MIGLRIKGNRNNIPLFRDVRGHLPDLLANRLSPINFTGLIIIRNMRYKILKVVLAANPFGGRNNHPR
jgi:hypothetical protein